MYGEQTWLAADEELDALLDALLLAVPVAFEVKLELDGPIVEADELGGKQYWVLPVDVTVYGSAVYVSVAYTFVVPDGTVLVVTPVEPLTVLVVVYGCGEQTIGCEVVDVSVTTVVDSEVVAGFVVVLVTVVLDELSTLVIVVLLVVAGIVELEVEVETIVVVATLVDVLSDPLDDLLLVVCASEVEDLEVTTVVITVVDTDEVGETYVLDVTTEV